MAGERRARRQHRLTAVRGGDGASAELHGGADSDEAVRLLTVLMSGLVSQQMANEPGVPYEAGRFTRLTDEALDMFVAHYDPTGRT